MAHLFPGSKLDPVLLKPSSRFLFNGGKLDAFREVLNKDVPCAFKSRDRDGFRQEPCDILMKPLPGNSLRGGAEKIPVPKREGKTVAAYFTNTMEGDAINDAMIIFHINCLEENHEVLH
jgi:hypothetical protein